MERRVKEKCHLATFHSLSSTIHECFTASAGMNNTKQYDSTLRSTLFLQDTIYPQSQNKLCWSRLLHGTIDFFFLSVLFVLILLHCWEHIKPTQQDFNQDFLFLCMKMISRDNEIHWSFLVGLQYVTAWTTFQPTEKRRNLLKAQCMFRIRCRERRRLPILL